MPRAAAAGVGDADVGDADVGDADVEALRAGIARLDERSRTVIAMLLEGRTQAVIAHVLGVCEGTVSRIRARALARLREILAEE